MVASVSPWDDYTVKQLFGLAEKRIELQRTLFWEPTSCLMALIHNMLSKPAKSPSDFNPMAKKNKKPAQEESLESLMSWAGIEG